MKTDLATSIIAAIVGTVAAYFLCNLFTPAIENYSVKVLSSEASYNLLDPNNEVFNFRAVNPTVEVYVGQCEDGDCSNNIIIDLAEENSEETPAETPDEESNNGATD